MNEIIGTRTIEYRGETLTAKRTEVIETVRFGVRVTDTVVYYGGKAGVREYLSTWHGDVEVRYGYDIGTLRVRAGQTIGYTVVGTMGKSTFKRIVKHRVMDDFSPCAPEAGTRTAVVEDGRFVGWLTWTRFGTAETASGRPVWYRSLDADITRIFGTGARVA